MCAGAIVLARLRRVVFGCPDPKAGAAGGWINILQSEPLNHRCELTGGVMAKEAAALLKGFFGKKRSPSADN